MMLLIEPIDKKIIHIECQCEDMVFERENLKKGKVVKSHMNPMHIVVSLIFNDINYRG